MALSRHTQMPALGAVRAGDRLAVQVFLSQLAHDLVAKSAVNVMQHHVAPVQAACARGVTAFYADGMVSIFHLLNCHTM